VFRIVAMANQRLGNKGEARLWYDRSVEWMNSQSGADPEVTRFRSGADALFK
jgi:hypothetical protein